jgi:HlyD family secretion protein
MNAALGEAKARLGLARSQSRAAASEADEHCTLAEVREREATRREALLEQNLSSREEAELARGNARASRARCTSARDRARAVEAEIPVAEAAIERARTELARTRIVAPFDGKILEILARPGELVTTRGALELGRVDRMMAVAEVYEADIHRVRIGQRAEVSSPALGSPLSGTVERIRPKVQKQDVTDTDPAARKDARVVEVEVLLDDAEAAANLTHLQVTVVIDS